MRQRVTTAILAGALIAVPLMGIAATRQAAAPAKPASSKAAVASHATKGVVKSVDATSLVITRSGRQKGDITFALSPGTERQGNVEVGSTVEVRYRTEGKSMVATAIAVQPAAPHKTPSGK
jgi:hypothetical protein